MLLTPRQAFRAAPPPITSQKAPQAREKTDPPEVSPGKRPMAQHAKAPPAQLPRWNHVGSWLPYSSLPVFIDSSRGKSIKQMEIIDRGRTTVHGLQTRSVFRLIAGYHPGLFHGITNRISLDLVAPIAEPNPNRLWPLSNPCSPARVRITPHIKGIEGTHSPYVYDSGKPYYSTYQTYSMQITINININVIKHVKEQ